MPSGAWSEDRVLLDPSYPEETARIRPGTTVPKSRSPKLRKPAAP
jgi:hypothetical protein